MKVITVFITLLLSINVQSNPGTISTDDTRASQAEASLSGFRKTGFEENPESEKQEEVKEVNEDEECAEIIPEEKSAKGCTVK